MYTLQPEKKNRGCITFLAVIGAIAIILVGLFVVVVFVAMDTPSYAGSAPSTHRVVYKVITDRDSSVYPSCFWFDATYEMSSGTAQNSIPVCDGARTAIVDERTASRGDFVYLAVQNDEWLARIGCEIHVDGKLVHRTYSEGQYVIASCSGTIP